MRPGRRQLTWLVDTGLRLDDLQLGGQVRRDVFEAKQLKALEEENAKLKKLLAEQMLDAAALCERLSKK